MLSQMAKSLWAKKTKGNQEKRWLPLFVHLSDAAEIARFIWNQWLPPCTKRKITMSIYKELEITSDSEDAALPCFVFLAAVHDLGKATPAFQGRLMSTEFDEQLRKQINDAGLTFPGTIHHRQARHHWASQLILENNKFSRKLAVILGGHHGQPPSIMQLKDLRAYLRDLGWDKGQELWCDVQHEFLSYAITLAGVSEQEAQSWQPDITAQVLLSGLVIMVDWIASNETLFPHIDLFEYLKPSDNRAMSAWNKLKLPDCWIPTNAWMDKNFYEKRFDKKPRSIQTAILNTLKDVSQPGIVILEAPMGEGKTEAALATAELLANKMKRNGIFFALPTQASANGLFLRFCRWIENLEDGVNHAVRLAHGKADLNELYNKIKEATKEIESYWVGGEEEDTIEDTIIVHDWFSGRKKGILTEFAIGTIDQVLMGGLKQKHLALRHLGLANKVVILDECHAYDAYMSQYLYKILNWLGAYGVQVIVLSATLPGEKRKQLIEAYLNKNITPVLEYDPLFGREESEALELPSWITTYDYPIITYTNGYDIFQENVCGQNRSLTISLEVLSSDEQIISVLENLLSDGGCAGIIVNTVKRAQKIAYELNQRYGDECVQLLHSRFVAMDRVQKEKELFEKLGPDADINGKRPHRCIVVGTQIFEQSCDLDFDILITDICPMDLLIQRIGRLHRHERKRLAKLMKPICFISGITETGFDSGAENIYGKYLLMNTQALLPSHITLPKDIPQLVQKTYNPVGLLIKPALQDVYKDAKSKHEHQISQRKRKALDFQISSPNKRIDNLVGWLDTSITDDPSGKRGEATVRDTDNTLEVLVVQQVNKEYYMLPWLTKFGGQRIPTDIPPPTELTRAMLECSLQLPRELCWNIDKTIEELEKISLKNLWVWQRSPLLKGELFLILDSQLNTELCGYSLHYDQSYGLISKN
ncbi:MAG: CRISPR-associated helicase Cas3' [Acetivibrionales bacterium]|jgi:CRISPR-associated endonuclease/helicase Cas3